MHSITTENGKNPEFPSNPSTIRQTSTVATQVHFLKNAINHLRNAYNGLDVEWTDPGKSNFLLNAFIILSFEKLGFFPKT
mgnify:CR=1 FL=1